MTSEELRAALEEWVDKVVRTKENIEKSGGFAMKGSMVEDVYDILAKAF